MFKESPFENQSDPFQIIHNYRSKFTRPKAKYVRKAPKINMSNVVQPPRNIEQYKNERKMTADSEIQLQLQNNQKQTGVQEFLKVILGTDTKQQKIENQSTEPFFYEKELEMPILIGPLLWYEPKNCCYKIKEDKSFIEDEDVNEEMH